MTCVRVIFGDQLFPLHHLDKPSTGPIVMIEDPLFCTTSVNKSGVSMGYRHHQQKVVLFLAAMRSYRDELRAAGYRVLYVELDAAIKDSISYTTDLKTSWPQSRPPP